MGADRQLPIVASARDRNQTQKQVRSEIERVLDEGLPEAYERALFKQKSDNVFELVVDYANRGRKRAAQSRLSWSPSVVASTS